MLDGAHPHTEGAERGRRTAVHDVLDVSWDQGSVCRAEENARVGGGWGQRELDRLAGMKPDTF